MNAAVVLSLAAALSLGVAAPAWAQSADLYVHVQTILRDSDGRLIAYLESTKFTDLNFVLLDRFLDLEAERDPPATAEIGGRFYDVIRRVQVVPIETSTVVASTNLTFDLDGQTSLLARFAHNGYPTVPGDVLESIWTFVRPARA